MIHHITAICAEPQRTTDFYVRVLGLRLVKLTINQDDVGTYHLYFADRLGRPGTVLTFFPWKQLPTGRAGPGMVSAVAFAAPANSLAYWEQRLREHGVQATRGARFDDVLLSFRDPDGLPLEIVGAGEPGDWTAEVPAEHAISGFYGATLLLDGYEATAQLLQQHFGYEQVAQQGTWFRFGSRADRGAIIDIHEAPSARPGVPGHGTVHHIAFRSADREAQLKLRQELATARLNLTPPIDRYYFSSVYFREPGGVLFEIATDGPGFTIDEPESNLGEKLVLPPNFEQHRAEIEKLLPPFSFPGSKN